MCIYVLIYAHERRHAMGGNLKNKKPVGMNLEIRLYERLKEYSNRTMIPMSKIVDKAIREYLDREERK